MESNHRCYISNFNVIQTFGFTKDPKVDDYILVMQYASEGDLHKYLQKEFANITWQDKLYTLWIVSRGYLCPNLLTANLINLILYLLLITIF